MQSKNTLPLFCLALLLGLALRGLAQAPAVSGRISGGFQAPASTDAEGRRSVLKGTDASHLGNRVYQITAPRVTTFRADDTLDMIIEAPRCNFDQNSNLAHSDSSLSVKTADDKFSIQGTGWLWRPNDTHLTISNNVSALIHKGAIANTSTNLPVRTASTNQTIQVTSDFFIYAGDRATFRGNVIVEDGPDRLTCDILKIEFLSRGGVQKIEAVDKVHLVQGETEVTSGHAIYDVNQNTIHITQSPAWKSGLREGSAQSLLLNRSNNTLFAEGAVYMKLPLTNIVEATTNTSPRTNRFLEVFSEKFTYQDAPSTNTPARALYEHQVRVLHPQGEIRCELLNVHFTPADNRVVKVVAEQNVQIQSRGSSAFGAMAVYEITDEKITLSGKPHWKIDENTGRSDLMIFYPKTDEFLALQNVEMTLPAKSLGQMQIFNAQTNPLPVASTNEPMRIYSRIFSHQRDLSVFQEDVRVVDARGEMACDLVTVVTGASNQVQRIIATNNVRIQQPDLIATGDLATYTLADGLVTLTGSPANLPVIITPERTVQAEKFVISRGENTFSIQGKYRIRMKKAEEKTRTLSAITR